MTRKTKSKSSILRIVAQFKDISTTDLAVLQATKNPDVIRQILGKPNLADKSAIAQARVAKQYVQMMTAPNYREEQVIKKKYKIILEKTNYNQNFMNMGNVIIGKKPKKKGYLRTFQDIIDFNGRGSSSQHSTSSVPKYYITKIPWNTTTALNFWKLIDLNLHERKELASYGIYTMQVCVKIRMDNGSDRWVSTKNMNIDAQTTMKIQNFMLGIKTSITAGDPYADKNGIIDKIFNILEIEIVWKP